MNIDLIITLAIVSVAAFFVGRGTWGSVRRALAPRVAGASACGGCSGCGDGKGAEPTGALPVACVVNDGGAKLPPGRRALPIIADPR